MSLGRSGPGVRSGFSRDAPHPLRWRFSRVYADRVPVRSSPTHAGRIRHRSEPVVDVDHGQLVYRSLKDVPVIVRLHELTPVGGRAMGGADGRWNQIPTIISRPSPPQTPPPRPRPRRLVDLGVRDPLKAPLALVDDLVQDPLAFGPVDVASAGSVAGTIAGAITTCLSAGGPVCRTERHLPRRPLDR